MFCFQEGPSRARCVKRRAASSPLDDIQLITANRIISRTSVVNCTDHSRKQEHPGSELDFTRGITGGRVIRLASARWLNSVIVGSTHIDNQDLPSSCTRPTRRYPSVNVPPSHHQAVKFVMNINLPITLNKSASNSVTANNPLASKESYQNLCGRRFASSCIPQPCRAS